MPFFISLFLWLRGRQFIIHCRQQSRQEIVVIDIVNQQHFFRAFIWKLQISIRHDLSGGFGWLDQEAVIINTADDSAAHDGGGFGLYLMIAGAVIQAVIIFSTIKEKQGRQQAAEASEAKRHQR